MPYRRNKRTGKWTVTVEAGEHPETGQRRRITREARTEEDARDIERDLLTRLATGVDISREAARLTVGQYLHDWVVGRKPDMTPNGWRYYEYICRIHLAPYLGGLRLQKLNPLDFKRFDGEHPVSPTLRFKRYWTLHAALEEAVKMQLILRNPLDAVRSPAKPEPAHETWSADDLRRFLDLAAELDAPYPDALALTALTGMREGELLGLRWQDVRLNAAQPHVLVMQQAQWVKGGMILVDRAKTKAGARAVALPSQAVEIVQRVQARRKVVSLREARLFEGLNPVMMLKNLKRLCREHGFPVLTVHELRHTNATLLNEAGVSAKAISGHLGHASIGVTLDVYTHMSGAMETAAVQAFERLLAAPDERGTQAL